MEIGLKVNQVTASGRIKTPIHRCYRMVTHLVVTATIRRWAHAAWEKWTEPRGRSPSRQGIRHTQGSKFISEILKLQTLESGSSLGRGQRCKQYANVSIPVERFMTECVQTALATVIGRPRNLC